jgi:hypothetical protein
MNIKKPEALATQEINTKLDQICRIAADTIAEELGESLEAGINKAYEKKKEEMDTEGMNPLMADRILDQLTREIPSFEHQAIGNSREY